MRKLIIYFAILISIIIVLVYYIVDAKNKNDDFIEIKDHIEKLIITNKDFDIYLKHKYSFDNFDLIEHKVNEFNLELDLLKSHLQNLFIKKELDKLNIKVNNKIDIINHVKSNRAILNNSFRIMQIIKKNNELEKYNSLYFIILSIDKNNNLDKTELLKQINTLRLNVKYDYEKYFLIHCKNIILYSNKIYNIKIKLDKFDIHKQLKVIEHEYKILSADSFLKASYSILFLLLLLFIVILLYILDERKLLKSYKELYKFRSTVQNSENIVVITDINKKITYVNESFCKITKYSSSEVIGKTPSILKSGFHDEDFYKKINDKIFKGKQWSGEFVNTSKDGKISYERATITPSLDDEGNIVEFVSIKQDITNEKQIQEELLKNEKLIIQQSKMAAMGEMLENIAHQWRQPLSTISTISSGIIFKKEMGLKIDEQDELDNLNKIINTTTFLSNTIDDFRNFFKNDKTKILFNIKDSYTNSLNMINSKFKSSNIHIIENIEDVEIQSYESELMQVFINILNNAKDVLLQNEIENKLIFIDIFKKDDTVHVIIKDNANGVPLEYIDKIFEPYFTTKHKSQGTGIGLYMSSEIINKHLGGHLYVKNEEYEYKNEKYKGAVFYIEVPIIGKKEENAKR